MMVWLHSLSPPQHIANVPEAQISTEEKLRTFMEQTNARRMINLKWAGIFENERGEVTCHTFWEMEKANEFRKRNLGKLDLLLSTCD